MRLCKTLVAFALALAPTLAVAQVGQQPGVTQPPSLGSAGGTITGPILAPTGCTAPPYGFTGGTAGLCATSTTTAVLQSRAASVNRSAFSTAGDIARIESFSPGGVLDSRLDVFDGGMEFTGGTTFAQRLRVAQTVFDIDLAAGGNFTFDITSPSTTDVAQSLRDVATNTFLGFTNVADPAKTIAFTQDSSLPSLAILLTDGVGVADLSLSMAGTSYLRFAGAAGTSLSNHTATNATLQNTDSSSNLSASDARGLYGVGDFTTGTKPTCDSTKRHYRWFTEGGAGVADTYEVCSKDAADAYAWRSLLP